ncbi:MAG: hypothetical protein P1V51_10785 [Deltaproteobacteria bacterium]|nr:hypothetical protein [Deltaproteobacteria bacterium]
MPDRSGSGRTVFSTLSLAILGGAMGVLLTACGPKSDPKLFLGQSCADRPATDCASSLCLSFDSATAICTQVCDPVEQDCPEAYLCQPTDNPAGNHCVPRALVDNCDSDAECPSGHRCDTTPGPGLGVCYVPVQRTLCAPCQSSLQCPAGGGCFEASSGEAFCTEPCGAGGACPAGYVCSTLPELGEQCVPERQTCSGGKPVCAQCRGDAECGGFLDLCVENLVTGEHFCGQVCDPATAASCPAGFGCVDLSGMGSGPFQCVPNASTCEGYCDAAPGDLAKAEAQCGFGRMCDTEIFSCIEADDGRLCAPCADDDDCRMGGTGDRLCIVNVGSTETFCGSDCTTDACPLGFSCIDVEAFGVVHKQCVPTRGSCLAGTGRLGDECTANGAGDCITGICLDFGTVDLCTARCTSAADCGDATSGYTCCNVAASGTEFDCTTPPSTADGGVCAPVGGTFGADCTPGQPPCRSGVCLDIGTARLCTQTCTGDADCPENFACAPAVDQETGADAQICFPSGGGTMGANCDFGPAACASKYCIKSTAAGNFCSVPCETDGTCPEDWICDPEATTVDGREVALCFPPQLAP